MTGATVNGTSVSYAYRGDDLRHSKTLNGVTTTYTWDLNQDLPVVLQEGNTSYVYGLGLISQTTGADKRYFLADGLGSTAALTDPSGAVTATYKYDVFGAIRSSTGADSTDFQFTGQQDDPTVGLQYLRARYYDQSTGRFLSRDPIAGTLFDPRTQNAFPYVSNTPVGAVDPSGEFLNVLAGLAVGAVIGGGMSLISQLGSNEGVNWARVGLSAVGGAIGAGATMLSGGNFVVGAGVGAVATDLLNQNYEKNHGTRRHINYAQTATKGVLAASLGGFIGLFGAVGSSAASMAGGAATVGPPSIASTVMSCVKSTVGFLSGTWVSAAFEQSNERG